MLHPGDRMNLKISNRGFSIIGSLLGFSLLGLSTVGLATYMGSFEQVKVTYARQSNVNFMHSELLGSMEKIITRTTTKISGTSPTHHDKKEHGICEIVKDDNTYDQFKDKAICAIMIGENSITTSGYYTNDRWTYFIEEGSNWEISAGNCGDGKNGFVGIFSEDHFNKCVEYVGKTETAGIFARLSMEPQRLPSFNKITSSTNKIPVDELVYKFKSVISIPKELEPNNPTVYSLSQGEKYLWSAEVLDCHICNDENCKLARFSTSSQGTAARHSRVCYHSLYETQEKKDALEILVEKIPPKFTKSGDRIVAGALQNYSSSCRSNLFRCGNAVKKEDFDPAIKFRFLLNYDQVEDSYINKMDLKVTNGSDNRRYGTLFVSADQKARIGRKSTSSSSETFTTNEWPLRAGTNEITAFMADQKASNSICTDVCSASSPTYYPQLTVEYGGSQCDSGNCSETLTASSRKIACFQCNMKSCHRYGENTHADVNDSRDAEPLDGVVPECVIEGAISTTPDLTQITGGSTVDNQCLKTISGGLQTNNCTNTAGGGDPEFKTGTTKSACFSEGKTKVLEGGYTGGLDARLNCMQNLQEEQLIGKVDPNDKVWREGVLPSLSMAYNVAPSDPVRNKGVKEILESAGLPVKEDSNGDKYVFNNYARFSTFLGNHRSVGEADVFVSHQRDASGMFHSGWHRFMGVAVGGQLKQKERWAFFYREPFNSINFHDANRVGGPTNSIVLPTDTTRRKFLGRVRPTRPIYIKMDADFHPDYPNTKQVNNTPANHYLGLIHHLAFKGIRPIKTPSANNYPYLCRNTRAATYKESFVTTVAEGKVMSSGYAKCRELGTGWHFIPPDSREFWAAALQAVAPNAPRYPFPNPFKFVDGIPFWTELKGGDTGYDSKKRQWKLSYNYEDISATDDYVDSQDSDHEFFFNKERGVLATPATAWIGGLKPINSSGTVAGVSIGWRPDWEEILGSTFTTPDPIEENSSSLLFTEDKNATEINNILTAMDNDTDFNNLGAINYSGRVMTIESLREPGDLSEFKTNTTKLCRYNENVQELDFHKALIATGSGSDWPSGGGDCSALDGGSRSFLANHVNNIYFQIPSTPGINNLADLTGNDFVEVRKGIRTLIPLLHYHKQEGIYIRNDDKFCQMWKREKKRRAVGNCIIESWNQNNSKTLDINGVAHGYDIAKAARKDTTICHTGGKLCDGVVSYYSSFPGRVTTERAYAEGQRAYYDGLSYTCAANQDGADDARDRFEDYRDDLDAQKICVDNAVTQATKANCISAISNENLNEQIYTPPALRSCSKNFFGTSIDYKYDFNSATDSRCWNLKEGSELPGLTGYGLRPESTVNYDSSSGDVGVLEDNELETNWTKNADCYSTSTQLEKLPATKCGQKYADPVDLPDDDLCDDSDVDHNNYANETCASHKNNSRRKPDVVNTMDFTDQRPASFTACYHSRYCSRTCTYTDPEGDEHTFDCSVTHIKECCEVLPSC